MKSLQSDPEFKAMFDDMKAALAQGKDGMATLQKYYNDPEILKKISEKLGGAQAMAAAASGGSAEKPEPKDLFDAAQYNDPEAAEEFLTIGKDVNEKSVEDQTPLHVAVAYDSAAVAKVLIEGKANLEAKDGKGMTPLHFAAGYGRAPLVELLPDKGADSA